jgi:hypothetical protein
MLETIALILLCLMLFIATVGFGVAVVMWIILEIKDFRNEIRGD